MGAICEILLGLPGGVILIVCYTFGCALLMDEGGQPPLYVRCWIVPVFVLILVWFFFWTKDIRSMLP